MTGTILIACVGNTLRSDDGVGPRIAQLLEAQDLPAELEVRDFGIGGIHLVQALMATAYTGLIIVDCADQGRPPGTVMEIDPEVVDVHNLDHMQRYDYLADMHYTDPRRALALARGLGVLPDRAVILGIQPEDAESLGHGLSPRIEEAAHVATRHVVALASRLRAAEP